MGKLAVVKANVLSVIDQNRRFDARRRLRRRELRRSRFGQIPNVKRLQPKRLHIVNASGRIGILKGNVLKRNVLNGIFRRSDNNRQLIQTRTGRDSSNLIDSLAGQGPIVNLFRRAVVEPFTRLVKRRPDVFQIIQTSGVPGIPMFHVFALKEHSVLLSVEVENDAPGRIPFMMNNHLRPPQLGGGNVFEQIQLSRLGGYDNLLRSVWQALGFCFNRGGMQKSFVRIARPNRSLSIYK